MKKSKTVYSKTDFAFINFKHKPRALYVDNFNTYYFLVYRFDVLVLFTINEQMSYIVIKGRLENIKTI